MQLGVRGDILVNTKKETNSNAKSNLALKYFSKIQTRNLGVFIGFIILCIFFGITTNNFFTVNNLLNVAMQTSIIAIVAIGQTYVIIKAGIDLSVGSIVAISGVIVAESLTYGLPIWLSVLLGIGVGVLCGLINGFIIAVGKVPPFIATLGMMSVARGIVFIITDGVPIAGLPREFNLIGGGKFLDIIPYPILITIFLAIIMGVVLKKSRFGRNVYAIGSNESAAFLSGIRVVKTKIYVYALSGLMSGIAGILLTSRLVAAQPTAGEMYELDAIAAVVIGGASLMGGSGAILGTMIGVLIMGVLRNGLNLLGISYFWQQVAIGIVIIIAVYFDTYKKNKKS
ncbi:ABC transporter permease [Ralstonia pickettii]|nr:ABC transporter permease [Ralstonia pickettii]